eukprot:CAMPEP_0179152816 /NCGR_PEP_ID=MMETSP0796-20121207/74276_1 /TAXON_ID=73915 /ORGANISM="Pyrodinium bahamense, Strain pbaha01" /LENGTH=43 /DNA_ID= /DNA_START= /DNA_END= /DNA_ORIENTATION=
MARVLRRLTWATSASAGNFPGGRGGVAHPRAISLPWRHRLSTR